VPTKTDLMSYTYSPKAHISFRFIYIANYILSSFLLIGVYEVSIMEKE